MKKYKIFAYIIVILSIIGVSVLIYNNVYAENEDFLLQEKVKAEIEYLEGEIINIFNSLNNINIKGYTIVSEEIEVKSSEDSANSSSASSNNEGSGTESSSSSETEEYNIQDIGILTSGEQEINWEEIKEKIELIHQTLPTITLDLYELQIGNEQILNFNNEIDRLTILIKEQDKEKALVDLALIYEYIVEFSKKVYGNTLESNILEVKKDIFKSYSILDTENYVEMEQFLNNALTVYSNIIGNMEINEYMQYEINKGYVMLNELKNAVLLNDREVYLIKYKNLVEQLSNI